ncbi:MAG: hypothetical protein HRF50_11085 [Phycisphaerae bacterium]|jgi:hypothetical protein
MSSIETLQRELELAKRHELELCHRFSTGFDHDEYRAAVAAVLELERQLAAAQELPYAVPLGFPARWDTGAPLPHLFRNDYKAYLIFYLATYDPNWDGSYIKVKHPGDTNAESLALVEFVGCLGARLGAPNEEVLRGHYLHGRGQESFTAQLVRNSPWIAELRSINSVHERFRASDWDDLKHYVFWFHDSTFESVARDYRLELHTMTMPDLAQEALRRLLG